ncbi:hypothetical protein D5S19_18735 [Amycolatopsis panacis]|uniref:Gas vesicle protein GvpFL n=1 Tax=Amycolatopsis panacis TaxID=2340917 RepID=A0A419I223_9PSEU|nr:GvpL/GvpF family gas vesicle protein [Amycolatopsis panacis]RJQ83845.1 hypothetical protein D5S19_18735 [Amycolatopsis panacis]
MTECGLWLYAVTRRAEPGTVTGVAAETPRAIEAAGLTAVVGDVPLSVFGDAALHRNLEDLDWLAAVARAHDTVIGALVAQGPVVPVRLTTVYRDDDGVRAVLREREAEFTRVLDNVTGRTEWGVKVFLEQEPETGSTVANPAARGAGTAYLARRRAALTAQQQQERSAGEQASRVHTRLAELAVASRLNPPQNRTLAGEDARMILNAAYLVEDDKARSFTEAATRCDRDEETIRVQLTGPWPPYSFSSWEEP